MNLNETQSLFSSHLITLQPDSLTSEESQIVERLSLPQTFELYHHAYFTRLTSALNATFNSVQRLMGTDLFRDFCHEYIASRPSTDCQVRFIEAMVIFHSNHGVYDFWRDTLDPQSAPENLLIFKRQGRVHVERLSVAEVRLLRGLQEGHPLSQALNDVSDLIRPGEIQNLLHRLADREIIEDLLILET